LRSAPALHSCPLRNEPGHSSIAAAHAC
jgi:hypothetical protein